MGKVILAKNVVLDGEIGIARPNDNQIVFGSTGSGKSLSTLIPSICHMKDDSFIGTFAKSSIVSKAVSFFKKRGYETYVWNLANPSKGDCLPDPLAYVKSDDDVEELARQIVYSNPQSAISTKVDPYWHESAQGLLVGLMYYVFMTEAHPCMKQVINLFYNLQISERGKGITTTLDDKIARLEKRVPDCVAVRKLRAFLQLPYSTASCVRDDLEKTIQNTFPISVQTSMNDKASVNFKDVATERTAIFIITSPVRATQYIFSNLLFSIAIRELMEYAEKCEDYHLPRHVKLLFDDFSCGFKIEGYERTISTFRAAGISAMHLCQSLSQLDATYGSEGSTTILDNCSTMVYLPGGINEKTCSYVSRILNLPLEDVMFMPLGNAVVIQSGQKPIIAPRYNTLDDPLYQELVACDDERNSQRTA